MRQNIQFYHILAHYKAESAPKHEKFDDFGAVSALKKLLQLQCTLKDRVRIYFIHHSILHIIHNDCRAIISKRCYQKDKCQESAPKYHPPRLEMRSIACWSWVVQIVLPSAGIESTSDFKMIGAAESIPDSKSINITNSFLIELSF